MVWKCPPLNLFNWNNLWKWRNHMNQDDQEQLEQDLRHQLRIVQDELIKTQTELMMALAELEAMRHQLISAERGRH